MKVKRNSVNEKAQSKSGPHKRQCYRCGRWFQKNKRFLQHDKVCCRNMAIAAPVHVKG